MQICLKKIKGLQDVKLVDSKFKWTEQHSQWISIIIEIQWEAMKGVYLQKKLNINFKVINT